MEKARRAGKSPALRLYHIYVGYAYQGSQEAKNPLHAVSMWAKAVRCSQDLLRAELVGEVKRG